MEAIEKINLMKNSIRGMAAALALCASFAMAQNYPGKTIHLIVPFPPGANLDLTARILGASLAEQFGQSVIVENRAGADGAIGASMVAKSAPDGYTLLVAGSGTVTTSQVIGENVPYDSIRDFAAVSMVHITPNVIAASLKVPIANINMRSLIAYAKDRPGAVSMGSTGTSIRLAIELINTMAGVKFLAVPYKGGGPAITEVAGGQIDSVMIPLPGAVGVIRDGRVKALAVTALKRSSVMPDIPTLDESGLKGFDASAVTGILAPAGTPPAVVNILNAAFLKAVRSAAVKESFKTMGADPQETTPEQFSAYIRSDIEKWKKVAQAAGIKSE